MRKALGRGLDALLPPQAETGADAVETNGASKKIAISKIRPNHLQPRRYFDPEKLSELAASIKSHGLAQPILVSPDENGTYEIIAGERRLRACQLAGLQEVEVVIRSPQNDQDRLGLALIENLQREDLNAMETALGYYRLMREFGVNQAKLGELVGKSQPAISNTLRLLELPEEIQKAIRLGELQEGHGRALLMVRDPMKRHELFKKALEQKLSVREIEDVARQDNAEAPPESNKPARQAAPKSADIRELESALQQKLGTKVLIRARNGGGKGGSLVIHYGSPEDFERIIGHIK